MTKFYKKVDRYLNEKFSTRQQIAYGVLISILILIAVNLLKDDTNHSLYIDEPVVSSSKSTEISQMKDSTQECKKQAVELAARVKVNIDNGQTDYFYSIDLSKYQQQGCKKEYIMRAVEAML